MGKGRLGAASCPQILGSTVSRGGRGGCRTQRYPSQDEHWRARVLERGSWRARGQVGLESSSGFWEECQGQEIVDNDAVF